MTTKTPWHCTPTLSFKTPHTTIPWSKLNPALISPVTLTLIRIPSQISNANLCSHGALIPIWAQRTWLSACLSSVNSVLLLTWTPKSSPSSTKQLQRSPTSIRRRNRTTHMANS
jgi:hypothetical protein